MADTVYRMKLFLCLTEPMHIAFKTNRERTVSLVKGDENWPRRRKNLCLADIPTVDAFMQQSIKRPILRFGVRLAAFLFADTS